MGVVFCVAGFSCGREESIVMPTGFDLPTRLKIALFSSGDDPPLPQRPISRRCRVWCEATSGGGDSACVSHTVEV